MPIRILMHLTGRNNLPRIRQPKTVADFTRVVEQTGILKPKPEDEARP